MRTHPGTGQKTLYIGHASHTLGMPEGEGGALLQELLDQQPGRRLFTRRDGDLAMSDNRCLLRRALANYEMSAHRRVLHRTVVTGTAPF